MKNKEESQKNTLISDVDEFINNTLDRRKPKTKTSVIKFRESRRVLSPKVSKNFIAVNQNTKNRVKKLRKRIFSENFANVFQNFEDSGLAKNVVKDLPAISPRPTKVI